jgi:cellulose biosynthesis protein BcsQ
VTWCLADTLLTYSNASVLMFDLDAQMSLTQAISLNEDKGTLYPPFGRWYEKSVAHALRGGQFHLIDERRVVVVGARAVHAFGNRPFL